MATHHPRMRAVLSVLFDDLQGGSLDEVATYDVVPKSVEVTANSFRQADTFGLELDYTDLPFDPRTIRSVLVAIYMADVRDPQQVVSVTEREHLRFLGYVDEPETMLGDSGESVSLGGRDYTGLFLDYAWRDGLINVDRPFKRVVEDIAATVPGAGGVLLDIPAGVAAAKVSDRIGRTQYAPREGDDAWTILAELCQLLGVLPVFHLDTLEVRSADTFGTNTAAFLYGENLARLKFGRKLNEVRNRQVRVVCWDEKAREAREATWPTEPIITGRKVSTEGKVSVETAPVVTYDVAGSYGQVELRAIAQTIYEESARQQVEGELETRDMRDALGLTDLTQLRNGDAILVQLGRQDAREWMVGPWDMPEAEVIRRLTRGPNPLNPDAAKALARSRKVAASLAERFYVQQATHRMSRDDGYSLTVRFINYVGGGDGGR